MKSLKIVGIGGGTGLPVVLRGLAAESNVEVSAVVTVTDNGGSSGRLRAGFGVPAVGDLRNCLVALSGGGPAFGDLFQHRFAAGDVDGHTLGNLILTALYQKTGSLRGALAAASGMLMLGGDVLASTEVAATLCARFADGSVVRGESELAAEGKRIEEVWLEPESPEPSAGVLDAIESADAIVLSPGSLFTSLIPNLLIGGVAESIRRSRAVIILVCNLMTQPGETDGFSASDHLRVVQSYLQSYPGDKCIDFCIVNTAVEPDAETNYQICGAQPVIADLNEIAALGAIAVTADIFSSNDNKVRHDPTRLARQIVAIAQGEVSPWGALRAA